MLLSVNSLILITYVGYSTDPKKRLEMGISSAKFAKEKLSYDAMTKNITNFIETQEH